MHTPYLASHSSIHKGVLAGDFHARVCRPCRVSHSRDTREVHRERRGTEYAPDYYYLALPLGLGLGLSALQSPRASTGDNQGSRHRGSDTDRVRDSERACKCVAVALHHTLCSVADPPRPRRPSFYISRVSLYPTRVLSRYLKKLNIN